MSQHLILPALGMAAYLLAACCGLVLIDHLHLVSYIPLGCNLLNTLHIEHTPIQFAIDAACFANVMSEGERRASTLQGTDQAPGRSLIR